MFDHAPVPNKTCEFSRILFVRGIELLHVDLAKLDRRSGG